MVNREISWNSYEVQETKRLISFVNGENEVEILDEFVTKDSFRVICLK